MTILAPDARSVARQIDHTLLTPEATAKAAEAALAIEQGADEIDMVIDIGSAEAGRFDDVQADIAAVRASIPAPKVLKVIIESAALTDAEIVAVCQAAVAAGADFVKTSTGFHPAGGATEHAVRLMKQTVGDRAQVKASGGVRSFDDARAMIAAGESPRRLRQRRTAQRQHARRPDRHLLGVRAGLAELDWADRSARLKPSHRSARVRTACARQRADGAADRVAHIQPDPRRKAPLVRVMLPYRQ